MFSSFGVINHNNMTIKHTSNSSGVYVTNPDGTVYQMQNMNPLGINQVKK